MQVRAYFGEGEIVVPPHFGVSAPSTTGFVICPLALQSVFLYDRGVQELYRLAYELAHAAHRRSWYEQLLRTATN